MKSLALFIFLYKIWLGPYKSPYIQLLFLQSLLTQNNSNYDIHTFSQAKENKPTALRIYNFHPVFELKSKVFFIENKCFLQSFYIIMTVIWKEIKSWFRHLFRFNIVQHVKMNRDEQSGTDCFIIFKVRRNVSSAE